MLILCVIIFWKNPRIYHLSDFHAFIIINYSITQVKVREVYRRLLTSHFGATIAYIKCTHKWTPWIELIIDVYFKRQLLNIVYGGPLCSLPIDGSEPHLCKQNLISYPFELFCILSKLLCMAMICVWSWSMGLLSPIYVGTYLHVRGHT